MSDWFFSFVNVSHMNNTERSSKFDKACTWRWPYVEPTDHDSGKREGKSESRVRLDGVVVRDTLILYQVGHKKRA